MLVLRLLINFKEEGDSVLFSIDYIEAYDLNNWLRYYSNIYARSIGFDKSIYLSLISVANHSLWFILFNYW